MTGDELKTIRLNADLSLRELAERWDVSRMTILREERRDVVRGLYADAARYLNSQRPS